MNGRLNDKIALVTGGVNGIGRACVERLSREGAQVVISDLQDESGKQLAATITASGGAAIFISHDVTDETQWAALIFDIDKKFGRLDILVNNAGIAVGSPSITEFGLADWRRQQSVNVEGVFLGIKYALPLIRRGGGGSIINMSSIAGLCGSAPMSAYSATKGAVRLFTKSIAMECAALRDGVRVNSVHPGLIDTGLWEGILKSAPSLAAKGNSDTRNTLNLIAQSAVPVGKAGHPEDIAAAVAYLASDDSSYVTGTELVVDGGFSAH